MIQNINFFKTFHHHQNKTNTTRNLAFERSDNQRGFRRKTLHFNEKPHKTPSDHFRILRQNGDIFLTIHARQSIRTQTLLLHGATLRFIGKLYVQQKKT